MMTSPYLDRPLLPLAVALPRMLREIKAALATAGPVETRSVCNRVEWSASSARRFPAAGYGRL